MEFIILLIKNTQCILNDYNFNVSKTKGGRRTQSRFTFRDPIPESLGEFSRQLVREVASVYSCASVCLSCGLLNIKCFYHI